MLVVRLDGYYGIDDMSRKNIGICIRWTDFIPVVRSTG